MNKSLNRVLLGAGLAAIALLSLSAATWSKEHGGMSHDPARMIAHMADSLELSEAQRSQVQQILSSSQEQTSAYREELQQLREQLRAMREGFDEDTARSITDRIGVIMGEMAYVMASTHAEIYAMLTPQQRAELDAMREQRDTRRGKGQQRGRDTPDEEQT